jgi:hypothetical protein
MVAAAVRANPVAPAIVGGSGWVTVQALSTLGATVTQVGPVPVLYITPTLTAAVTSRVRALVQQASDDASQAIAADSSLCSRCVRTLLRSAVGSAADASKIITPEQPGDQARYTAAWAAVGAHVQRIQRALAALSAEAATGQVRDAADDTLHVTGAPNVGGAPIKAGQWSEYKLCACGDPSVEESKPTMIVAGVNAPHHAGGRHHTGCGGGPPGTHGACGCGCAASKS